MKSRRRRIQIRLVLQAFGAGRFVTGILYLLLLPLSPFAEPREEKRLHTDVYVMF